MLELEKREEEKEKEKENLKEKEELVDHAKEDENLKGLNE